MERRVTIEIGSNILTISSWPRVTDVLGMSLYIFFRKYKKPGALGNACEIRGLRKEGQAGRALKFLASKSLIWTTHTFRAYSQLFSTPHLIVLAVVSL